MLAMEAPVAGEGDEQSKREQREREAVGNRTMQIDAVSDEMFEEIDGQVDSDFEDEAGVPGAAAPPPLPRRKRWTLATIAALVGVVLAAAVLGLLAARLFLGDAEEARRDEAAAPDPAAPEDEGEEVADDRAPLQLDPVIIESGGEDEPFEGESE